MNKKNKKSSKNTVSLLAKLKSLNKKTIIISLSVFCSIILIAAVVITAGLVQKSRADRTVRVAFYGLPDNICSALKEKIPEEKGITLNFEIISEGSFDEAAAKKKYDLLFTWRGEITDSLSPSAKELPSRVLGVMPTALRNKKCAPILLDHCELSFYTKVLNSESLETPERFSAYQSFLDSAKGRVFSPFFTNGSDDRILIDLAGALVMAKGGLAAYNKLIAILRDAENLDSVIDVKLDEKSLTLRSVIDMLKDWPENEYTHPAWFIGSSNDLVYFAEDGQLGSFFTLLSEHRKIPYAIIKNFESAKFPADVNPDNYGLIAPAVSVMLLSDNSNGRRYAAALFTEETQTELSDKTCLAPVHSSAEAYDKQADDVRYWAASCQGGALPDLYLAVYQRKPEALKNICAEIRNYLR